VLARRLANRAATLLVAALSFGVAGALVFSPAAPAAPPRVDPPRPTAAAAPARAPEPAPARAPAPPPPRADEKLDRSGRTAFSGGYLTLTPDFASPDGVYDLVIHFHGNTELVEQSLAHAKIGAVFVPQNLGIGSGAYERTFSRRGAFEDLLSRVDAAMKRRGLANARLGRIALVAWSAGYGGVLRILAQPALAERVDAVILLDCLHIGHRPGTRKPATDQIAPWERFARWAVSGQKLFVITHSEITPASFVGARQTTDILLQRLGILRYAGGEEAAIPDVPAATGVLPKRLRLPLSPLTLADRGKLIVRGYAGMEPEHHIYHLMEMGSIALPDLASWWARPRDGSP
jgi:hypothetical protein